MAATGGSGCTRGRRRAAALLVWSLALAGAAPAPASAPPPPSPESVRSLLAQGALREAEAQARALVDYLEHEGKGESPEGADALDLLVEAMWGLRDSRALPLAERAVRLRDTLSGRDLACARSLVRLANFHFVLNHADAARQLYEEALAIRRRLLDPQHRDIAALLNSLGSTSGFMGDWEVARGYFDRALAIYTASGEFGSREARVTLFNQAELLEQLGDYAAVRELYEALLEEMKPHPEALPLLPVRAWSWIAEMSYRLGDDPRAREAYDNAAGLWTRLQDRPEGRHRTPPAELANTAERLSTAAQAIGEQEEARRLALFSLGLREQSLGESHPETTWARCRTAEKLLHAGDLAGARRAIDQACGATAGLSPMAQARCLTLRSAIQRQAGEPAEARKAIHAALDGAREIYGPDHPELCPILQESALVELEAGDPGAALKQALQTETIARRHLRRSAAWLSQGEALRYQAARLRGLGLAVSSIALPAKPAAALSPDAVEQTWDAVIRSRGIVLDEMIARRRVVATAQDPGIAALVTQLEQHRARLARVVVRGPRDDAPQDFHREVRALAKQQEAAERRLAARSAALRNHLQEEAVGWDEVHAALPRDAALVACLRYDRRLRDGAAGWKEVPSYVAFLTTAARRSAEVVPLGSAREIDDLVSRWRAQVTARVPRLLAPGDNRAAEATREAGELLRRAIWDPIEAKLGREHLILVVPDASLHLVNLAALPARDGRYLVEQDRLFHSVSAERDLAGVTGVPKGRGLLAMGAPDYDSPGTGMAHAPGPAKRGDAGPGPPTPRWFPPLASARREVEQIAGAWSGAFGDDPDGAVTALVGAEAGERQLKMVAPGRRVIHLATHGFAEETVDVHAAPRRDAVPTRINPLLSSGLAFAGANLPHANPEGADSDDGTLLSEEILSLDLSGVEWVVLSACGSGLGPIQAGEGVHGLRRCFHAAGAATVITTLWDVEDASTHAWMVALYRGRLGGLTTAEAVRQASIRLLTEARRHGWGPDPRAWGGFLATGDWR